jgi:hypothetical protein
MIGEETNKSLDEVKTVEMNNFIVCTLRFGRTTTGAESLTRTTQSTHTAKYTCKIAETNELKDSSVDAVPKSDACTFLSLRAMLNSFSR